MPVANLEKKMYTSFLRLIKFARLAKVEDPKTKLVTHDTFGDIGIVDAVAKMYGVTFEKAHSTISLMHQELIATNTYFRCEVYMNLDLWDTNRVKVTETIRGYGYDNGYTIAIGKSAEEVLIKAMAYTLVARFGTLVGTEVLNKLDSWLESEDQILRIGDFNILQKRANTNKIRVVHQLFTFDYLLVGFAPADPNNENFAMLPISGYEDLFKESLNKAIITSTSQMQDGNTIIASNIPCDPEIKFVLECFDQMVAREEYLTKVRTINGI